MNLIDIKNQIEKIINSDIIYNRQVNFYNTSNPAEDLKKSNIITNTRTKYIRIIFEYNKTIFATCDYAVFVNENVGYISDINIHPDIQNNNIGTNIRQYIINELETQTNIIYSYPTNNIIKHICRKQGFEPSNVNKSWYVKK